jgi:hypothetical protein
MKWWKETAKSLRLYTTPRTNVKMDRGRL